jgi:2-polyprenyl-3-methyl-5-hydroxy-6-metoxy-1,4-benzoquinol methylase
MNDPYEVWGTIARSAASTSIKAGRRNMQAAAERLVPDDIAEKLSLTPECSLLDIGCGPGTFLNALAPRVKSAVGIDHPDLVSIARENCKGKNLSFVSGKFPETSVEGLFDRILIYSVLQYQQDPEHAFRFVDAALALLAPQGKLLIGDISNADRLRRFHESEEGKRFEKEWAEQKEKELAAYGDPFALFADSVVFRFDDASLEELLARYRGQGYEVSLLPQAPELPFGRTREDVLISVR